MYMLFQCYVDRSVHSRYQHFIKHMQISSTQRISLGVTFPNFSILSPNLNRYRQQP